MREVKLRAVHDNRRLKDVVAELLRKGLAAEGDNKPAVRNRVKLPLIVAKHPAPPGQELTPERIAEILAEEDARHFIP